MLASPAAVASGPPPAAPLPGTHPRAPHHRSEAALFLSKGFPALDSQPPILATHQHCPRPF